MIKTIIRLSGSEQNTNNNKDVIAAIAPRFLKEGAQAKVIASRQMEEGVTYYATDIDVYEMNIFDGVDENITALEGAICAATHAHQCKIICVPEFGFESDADSGKWFGDWFKDNKITTTHPISEINKIFELQ